MLAKTSAIPWGATHLFHGTPRKRSLSVVIRPARATHSAEPHLICQLHAPVCSSLRRLRASSAKAPRPGRDALHPHTLGPAQHRQAPRACELSVTTRAPVGCCPAKSYRPALGGIFRLCVAHCFCGLCVPGPSGARFFSHRPWNYFLTGTTYTQSGASVRFNPPHRTRLPRTRCCCLHSGCKQSVCKFCRHRSHSNAAVAYRTMLGQ